jgi:hydroxymethylpyrimidine/phosphomethylpyrimidine kinase
MAARTPVALTIAGSDSGGGAGIQADLKAFAARGVHGASAITAITAQNTVGVEAVHQIPPEIVRAQVRAVAADLGVDAVKVGMLGDRATTLAVAEALAELGGAAPVVVDPVMVAESGARLLDPVAQEALVQEILPLASVVTPNVPEARALLGEEPLPGADEAEAERLARAVLSLGPSAVVITGGHRDSAIDVLVAGADAAAVAIGGPRHPDGAAHGSGCTHSAALAASLALGETLEQAARSARRLAGEAVARGLRELGAGAGPVDAIDLGARRADRPSERGRLS